MGKAARTVQERGHGPQAHVDSTKARRITAIIWIVKERCIEIETKHRRAVGHLAIDHFRLPMELIVSFGETGGPLRAPRPKGTCAKERADFVFLIIMIDP